MTKRSIYPICFALLYCGLFYFKPYDKAPFRASAMIVQEAHQFQLQLPVQCQIGVSNKGQENLCVIHKYVDLDPGPERMDYACGRLSRDGDTGTDFRTLTLQQMENGVGVVAAADGTVKALRDGMADISVRDLPAGAIKNREAGNAVILVHKGGWETQYSHLKNGSVRVQKGQSVKAGDRLGEIGLSGNTEFPHVEFSLRRHGKPVDPFIGEVEQPFQCKGKRQPLWDYAALGQLDYIPTGLLSAGFAFEGAQAKRAREGEYDQLEFMTSSPALVFWVDIFGAEEGDKQSFLLVGPDNQALADSETVLKKNNIAWFAFAGKKRPDAGWPPGNYRAVYMLKRQNKLVIRKEEHITIGQ